MKHFMMFFNIENWDIVAFYPYTSCVSNRILAQNHNYKTDEHDFLDNIGNRVKEMVVEKGANWDNKVVIKLVERLNNLESKSHIPAQLYIGCYDGLWSMGLGMYQDEWLADRNKYFKEA